MCLWFVIAVLYRSFTLFTFTLFTANDYTASSAIQLLLMLNSSVKRDKNILSQAIDIVTQGQKKGPGISQSKGSYFSFRSDFNQPETGITYSLPVLPQKIASIRSLTDRPSKLLPATSPKARVCHGIGLCQCPWQRYSGENKYLTPCWFRKFGHLQINVWSIIVMVGLF